MAPPARSSATAASEGRPAINLPRGTVTLLFSDVEGSTQLQHRLGDRYQEVVETHRRLLETAFDLHGGKVVDRQTESFFCVFPRANDAIAAAESAQRALAAEPWPDAAEVRVRMGVHAGEPELAGDRYVGLAVARAARICAAAHGGQVLVSSSARALVADRQQASLRSLGRYRLKDFPDPEPLFQLDLDGLPRRFPPPRAEAPRSRREVLLLGAVALVVVVCAVGIVIAAGGSGGAADVGPTSIGVVDMKTSSVVGSVPLGYKSNLIASGEGSVWVVDPGGGTLTSIDPKTMKRKPPSSIGAPGTVPTGIAVGAGAIWVGAIMSDGSKLGVLELEPEFGSLEHEIVLDRVRSTQRYSAVFNPVLVSAGQSGVWVLEVGLGKVRHIDAHTGRATAGIQGVDATSIAAGPDAVWLGGRGGVTRLDPSTGASIESIPIAGASASQTTSIAVGGGGVWFVGSAVPTLFRISPSDNAVTSTSPVGEGPTGVAVGGGAIWVANSRDGTVTRITPGRGADRTIGLGAPPGAVVATGGRVWTSPGLPRT